MINFDRFFKRYGEKIIDRSPVFRTAVNGAVYLITDKGNYKYVNEKMYKFINGTCDGERWREIV